MTEGGKSPVWQQVTALVHRPNDVVKLELKNVISNAAADLRLVG
jgi:hypothetical protein